MFAAATVIHHIDPDAVADVIEAFLAELGAGAGVKGGAAGLYLQPLS